ncbi:uncharacterized protein LALA0_S10e04060g [Lachancea lanzarotensis]|uniref:LALA0S10e04060g1_1 n=1 Tax=Lachancea lanzarotensis TaxID=1245769 RepID=A0A0C7NCR7_9SACH|nr:uncharacterized protein LALA0_S10e04060g [Lachancea lanzarotensis]CEP64172.1 LALA0S10e04060g1_1 [Lachancea lanzarotensis]
MSVHWHVVGASSLVVYLTPQIHTAPDHFILSWRARLTSLVAATTTTCHTIRLLGFFITSCTIVSRPALYRWFLPSFSQDVVPVSFSTHFADYSTTLPLVFRCQQSNSYHEKFTSYILLCSLAHSNVSSTFSPHKVSFTNHTATAGQTRYGQKP